LGYAPPWSIDSSVHAHPRALDAGAPLLLSLPLCRPPPAARLPPPFSHLEPSSSTRGTFTPSFSSLHPSPASPYSTLVTHRNSLLEWVPLCTDNGISCPWRGRRWRGRHERPSATAVAKFRAGCWAQAGTGRCSRGRRRGGAFDNSPSQPHPDGRKAGQAVSSGSPVGEYPPRKETPKSTHARRRPGGDAPSDKHELCDRKFPCPRRRPRGNTHASPSYPVRSPQTLRKPPSDTLKGPSENPPLRAHGASLSGGRPKLRTPPWVEAGEGCYVTPLRRPGVRGAVKYWSMVQVGFTQNWALIWGPARGCTSPKEVSRLRLWLVSDGAITSGWPPE